MPHNAPLLTGASSQSPGFAGNRQVDFTSLLQQARQAVPATKAAAGPPAGVLQGLGTIAQFFAQNPQQAEAGQGLTAIGTQKASSTESAEARRQQQVLGLAGILANVEQGNMQNRLQQNQDIQSKRLRLRELRQSGRIADREFKQQERALDIRQQQVDQQGQLDPLRQLMLEDLQARLAPTGVEEVQEGPGFGDSAINTARNVSAGLGDILSGTFSQSAFDAVKALEASERRGDMSPTEQFLLRLARTGFGIGTGLGASPSPGIDSSPILPTSSPTPRANIPRNPDPRIRNLP